MSHPTLVVLAAGLGSRYGGVKQIERVGPGGETLLHYAIHDAAAAGFSRAVFVVRASIAEEFGQAVLPGIEGIECAVALQELDSLVPPAARERAARAARTKPWGTCHALLCAKDSIEGPFAAINADDFYGREAFAAMGDFLSGPAAEGPAGEGAIVPYRLDSTLSDAGTVSRGICGFEGGFLTGVRECVSIGRSEGRIVGRRPDGSAAVLDPASPVSMNFWGFPLRALDGLGAWFEGFLERSAGDPAAEAYLPAAVDDLIRDGDLRVRRLDAASEWFGMTYREDRERAAARIAALTRSGAYPSPLRRVP